MFEICSSYKLDMCPTYALLSVPIIKHHIPKDLCAKGFGFSVSVLNTDLPPNNLLCITNSACQLETFKKRFSLFNNVVSLQTILDTNLT